MKKFQTIGQAKKIARKSIRINTIKWLEAAAEDGFTKEKNFLDLKKIKIIPKLLNKVGNPKLNVSFFNDTYDCPIIIAPMGHQTQFHKNGEIETAMGAYKSNVLSFFGTQGRMSLVDIRKKNKNLKFGWEIFPFGNLDWINKQIAEVKKYGCNSIVVCLDANVRSRRHLDLETGYDARKFGKRTNPLPQDVEQAKFYDWRIIKHISKKSQLPVIAKGILTLHDAKLAIKNGAKGIWVSNHGGRMFNSGISSVEALKKVSQIKKQNNKIILIADGSVEKGTDIIKYLCLGADMVAIGRAALYGLIIDGNRGINKIIEILSVELKTAMINGGFRSLNEFKKNRIYE
tara:strand:+ start:4382 stop:5413 length:1032 start_codon:yes stop_codon:yes gene_type:complete